MPVDIKKLVTKEPFFLALDLELNQPSQKIIQVGVAIGGRLQSEEEYVVRQWLLSPEEPLAPEIVALTGITEEDLSQRAVTWEQMASELLALIEQYKPFVNPVTWGGGDSLELLTALAEKGIAFPAFGRRWIDCKTFHVFATLSRGKNPSGGLRSIMGRYGLTFKGAPHRADVDAYNTLRLFFRLLERQLVSELILEMARGS